MTKQFMVSLVLVVSLIAPISASSLEAAQNEAIWQPENIRTLNENAAAVDGISETDELADLLDSFSQWLDKFLSSDATRNTSVISLWNH